ncbi:MAG: ATP-binding protein [Alphaproteobacteria bacterium]|nr:ATP-binding protein [Alphaproteobacteria bacterium]
MPTVSEYATTGPDLRDIKGQESAKRALEVAVAGGHNLFNLWSEYSKPLFVVSDIHEEARRMRCLKALLAKVRIGEGGSAGEGSSGCNECAMP